MDLTHGELFAGIGGFGHGLAAAGIPTLWHVEVDPKCQRVLAARFPGTLLLGDVRTVTALSHIANRYSSLTNDNTQSPKQYIPLVDIISAGFPCQDVSVAGKRAGLAGERTGMFWEIIRIIKEMREETQGEFPKLVLLENVPGLLSSNGGRDFGVVLNALAGCGSVDIAWRVIDAQHWVPQRRRRVFVAALFPPAADGRAGIGRAAEILSLTDGGSRHPQKGRTAGQRPAARTEGGAGSSGLDVRNLRERDGVSGTLQAKENGGQSLNYTNPVIVPAVSESLGNQPTGVAGSEHLTYIGVPDPAYTIADSSGNRTGSGRDAQDTFVLAYNLQTNDGGSHRRQDRPEGGMYVKETDTSLTLGSSDQTLMVDVEPVYFETRIARNGSGQPHEIANALRSSNNTGDSKDMVAQTLRSQQHNNSNPVTEAGMHIQTGRWMVRRLTPTECQRLQGFPDGWLDGLGLTDSDKYRMCGNAVATPVTRWLGERVLAELLKGVQ